jgi:hypothetical protein
MARPKARRTVPATPQRGVRVRSRPLDEIDETKLAVALAMMARRLLEEPVVRPPAPNDPKNGGAVDGDAA